MVVDANLLDTGPRYRVRTPEERERAFVSAGRHSRMVRILRKTLPVAGLLVLAAYFVSTRMSVTVGDVTASIDGMEIADGNLRMLNPTLEGTDKKNGKYVVRAAHADQDIKSPEIIKLHAIKADLSSASGGWSRMEAVRGVFNSKAERLVMQDRITLATSSGVTGELKHASLEMDTQTLRSHQPVSFDLSNGTVTANALTFRSQDHILIFRGEVAVHLVKKPKESDGTPQPAQAPQAVQGQPVPGSVPVQTGDAKMVSPQ
ncbi:MAG TPA: LPS export ABC transporter periplasmic protein LptC [Methyloceanibacter sp.]|nr:LPS export ABC transporter periplasmic protein LptC [Methyloceanibacter sp.]